MILFLFYVSRNLKFWEVVGFGGYVKKNSGKLYLWLVVDRIGNVEFMFNEMLFNY